LNLVPWNGLPVNDANPDGPVRQLPFSDLGMILCLILDDRQRVENVMARATRELDLTEVHQTLNRWRRVAWVTTATGSERYRAVLASADQRLRTGERHPQATPWNQLKAELGLPE
jgi:hypothetical protein